MPGFGWTPAEVAIQGRTDLAERETELGILRVELHVPRRVGQVIIGLG